MMGTSRMFLRGLWAASSLLLAAQAAGAADSDAPAASMLVRPAWILEVETGKRHAGWALSVAGDRIVAVGPLADVAVPASATVIDLPGATLIPGMIDAHVHLTWDDGLSDATRDAARKTLEAGFTTVRSCGAPGGGDIVLRDAVERGDFPGPRVVAAGAPLGAAGGVCASVFGPPGVFANLDEALAHVRKLSASGASWVKICAGGGVVAGPDDEAVVEVPPETLAAIVAEAHRLGMKVAAHAQGPAAIAAAVKAGADSIEHGGLLDEAGAKLMARRRTWLVPTLYRMTWQKEQAAGSGAPAARLERLSAAAQVTRERLAAAIALGVPVALGTDATVIPHGLNAREAAALVEAGMTPLAALQSATLGAAALLGMSDKVGSLAPGRYADLVAIEGNPLEDPASLERVVLVVKAGRIVRGRATDGAPAPAGPPPPRQVPEPAPSCY